MRLVTNRSEAEPETEWSSYERAVVANHHAFPLSPAELRLVPFLATNLRFVDIAQRLYISRNTVKSQAISIYRKLGVSSRTAAIDALTRVGTIPDLLANLVIVPAQVESSGCPSCDGAATAGQSSPSEGGRAVVTPLPVQNAAAS